MRHLKLFLSLIAWSALLLTTGSCDSDGLDYPYAPVSQGNIEALVLNEGGFTTNQASLSVLNKDGSVIPDVFRQTNNRPMGDVGQSITLINGRYFVALNNSKKIEVIDPATFRSTGTILYAQAGFPRQIVPITDDEAIVSDQYNQLVRIRTREPYGEPTEYISIPFGIEYMAVIGRKLFGITTSGLYVFDTDRINKADARVIGEVKNSEMTKTCRLLTDKHGKLWALMHVTDDRRVTAIRLACVNPQTETVEKNFELPLNLQENPQPGDATEAVSYNRTDIDPTGTWIYFHAKTCRQAEDGGATAVQAVWRMNVDTGKFECHRLLPGTGMMYGFAVSPDGEVYLCDCLDYTAQRGYIRKYLTDGNIQSYRVGIYPCQVFFPRQTNP